MPSDCEHRSRDRSRRRHRSKSGKRDRNGSSSRRLRNHANEKLKTRSTSKRHTRSRSRSRHTRIESSTPALCSRTPSRDVHIPTLETFTSNVDMNGALAAISDRIKSLEDSISGTPKPQPESVCSMTQVIADAISSINPAKSQNYFVSNFDPSIHNISDWCQEVDRAKVVNKWDDRECLSRVAGCLKGDARVWLNE